MVPVVLNIPSDSDSQGSKEDEDGVQVVRFQIMNVLFVLDYTKMTCRPPENF